MQTITPVSYTHLEVNKLGLKFGIWFEPQMISPDPKLYEAHPHWAIQIPGREGSLCRNQYVPVSYTHLEVYKRQR